MEIVHLMLVTLCAASCITVCQMAALFWDGELYVSRLRISLSLWLPAIITIRAYGKKNLDFVGSIAAFFVGAVMVLHSYAHVVAMITFFASSSALTKFRRARKKKYETNVTGGHQRNWKQVISNGGAATLFALLAFIGSEEDSVLGGERRLRLTKFGLERMLWYDLAIMGSIASAAGDTWASEIGAAVGTGDPRLITNLRTVPRGTNGAISFIGTIASVAGGASVGVAYWLTILLFSPYQSNASPQWILIVVCCLCGFVGSLLDSFVGATLQYSGYDSRTNCIVEKPAPSVQLICGRDILDNNGVNLISCLLSSLMAPLFAEFICTCFV